VLIAVVATWLWWAGLVVVALGIVRLVVTTARGDRPWQSTSPVIAQHPRAFRVTAALVISVAVIWLLVQSLR
jgi:hypothetical protein